MPTWAQWPSIPPVAAVAGRILAKGRIDDRGGKDAGENRSQGAARAVDAEGIERVVVAEDEP